MNSTILIGLLLLAAIIAVVFFRKDDSPTPASPSAKAVTPPQTSRPRTEPTSKPVSGASNRRHVVEQGETLFHLAQRYYGDGQRSGVILQANRQVLSSESELSPGMVVIIPDLSAPSDESTSAPR